VIRLSREAETRDFRHTERFGTVLENVVCDPKTGALDLNDERYPRTPAPPTRSISSHASDTGRAPHPTTSSC